MTSAQAADKPFIILGSTTSTEQSGLFRYLLPLFTKKTGIEVRVVAVGTGQALKLGERGDVDLLLVHDPEGEKKFVAEGYGLERKPLMYNDFVLLGPAEDPAGIKGEKDILGALKKIADGKFTFASRGDDSGTDRLEKRLWNALDIHPRGQAWYRETGSGMGPTLNIAREFEAYVLSDRATWLAFGNKGDLQILAEGDGHLLNPYHVILINPQKHPHVKTAEARSFQDWLLSTEGQQAITQYKIGGQQLFFLLPH